MSKAMYRFRQLGGWRLARTYARMGLLPFAVRKFTVALISRKPLKLVHPEISKRVVPKLQKKYEPLAKRLLEEYKDEGIHETNPTVYNCWMQGLDSAPPLVKACLRSQREFIRNKDFVVITEDNFHEYVSLPQFILEKYEKGIIPHAHFTDLIRLQLLIERGGTWIDSTVLFSSGKYPDAIMDCPLFMFQYYQNGTKRFRGISNWFISARSHNRLLSVLRDMLFEYWREYDCVVEYYVFHLFFQFIAKLCPQDIAAMPKGLSIFTLQMAGLLEKAYDEKVIGGITDRCSIHKLDFRKTKLSEAGLPTLCKHIISKWG